MTATTPEPAKEWRNLFGVCAAIAEDFGFDPILLRIPFAVATIFWPMQTFALYFALGAVALVSRLVFPNRPAASAEVEPTVEAANSDDAVTLAKAA